MSKAWVVKAAKQPLVLETIDLGQLGCSGGRARIRRRSVNPWEIIADNLSKAGWSWGCVSAIENERSSTRR